MYLSPEIQVTSILGWLRELSIITGIVVFGWKSRGAFQSVTDFVEAIQKHMLFMEAFATRMESNHLKHMELYLYRLVKNSRATALRDPDLVAADEVPPPDEDLPNAIQI